MMISLPKKLFALTIVLILMLVSLPLPIQALENIDQTAEVSLTVHFLEDSTTGTGAPVPIANGQFDLYYVAKVTGYGSYALDGDFAKYPVQVNGLDADGWRILTSTLVNYVSADGLTPLDTGKTGETGELTFPVTAGTLLPGLYLVDTREAVGEAYTYQAEPFLVCLPGVNAEQTQWQHHVDVRVKFSKSPNPEAPSGTIDRRVLKVWEGDREEIRPEEIIIQLRKNGEVYDTVTLNAGNSWRYLWEDLPQCDADGADIDWSVSEKAITGYKFSVSLEGITFLVTNTFDPNGETGETVRRTVQKVWDDKGYESKRPGSIQVSLLRDGKVEDTQTLSAANDWCHSWDSLPAVSEAGEDIHWTVEEAAVSGYVPTYVTLGDTILITNSVVKPSLPQTGVLWWPVPVLIAAGLLFLILGNLTKGRKDDA